MRVAEVEVEKSLSVEESAVEYQRELWRSHYYKYYNPEGGAEDEDEDAVYFIRGDAESTNGGMSPGQVIDVSSHTGDAYAGAAADLLKLCVPRLFFNVGLLLEQCLGQLALCNY